MAGPPERISEERLKAAQRVAADARRGRPQLDGPQRTAAENENFVTDFLAASRLHFIGSWKERYFALLDTLPPPPPLPPPPLGRERTLLHVDMDCFFASVAMRNRPELEGLPVAVSWSESSKGNAEIASANYAARRCGVRNGMWLRNARELCPDIISMPYEFEAYTAAAEAMYKQVFTTTPHVMGVSVDECYADVTGLGEPRQLAYELRANIHAQATARPTAKKEVTQAGSAGSPGTRPVAATTRLHGPTHTSTLAVTARAARIPQPPSHAPAPSRRRAATPRLALGPRGCSHGWPQSARSRTAAMAYSGCRKRRRARCW